MSAVLGVVLGAALPVIAANPILGGTPTAVGDYPNVVVILVAGDLCTGTLITDRFVMTAGHCVTPSILSVADQAAVTASVVVHLGTVDISTDAGRAIDAIATLADPDFDPDNIGRHDLGLVELAEPVLDVAPVILNFDTAAAPAGIAVTQVGYGATAVGGLHVGVENVVAKVTEPCAEVASQPALDDAYLLCWSQTDGTGKCAGDSGGPSFAAIGAGGALVQVGATSFGDDGTDKSPECSQFGADTRIDAEAAFLMANVPELACWQAGGDAASCDPPTVGGGGCDAGRHDQSPRAAFVLVALAGYGAGRRRSNTRSSPKTS